MALRISFEFFKDQAEAVVESYEPHRRTWRDLRVYATDGDQYELPRTEEILSNGYMGYPCKNDLETHYPRFDEPFDDVLCTLNGNQVG